MTDINDLTIPPERDLPPEVRERMRAALRAGLHAPTRPMPTRSRTPLAVAAGVAVVALGATMLAQSIVGSPGSASSASHAPSRSGLADGTPPHLNQAAADVQLDRCWAAIQRFGKPATVPPRATWQAVFSLPGAESSGVTVVAARAAGKPLFCETTRTTVTVSDPNATPGYAPGSRTGALLITADGVIAGVVDPTWSAMRYASGSARGGSGGGPGYFQDGMFIDLTQWAGPDAWVSVQRANPNQPEPTYKEGDVSTGPGPGEYPEERLPPAPQPLVGVVDRPDPAPDRGTPAGRLVDQCLGQHIGAIPDRDSWVGVVTADTTFDHFVLARSGNLMASCDIPFGYPQASDYFYGLQLSTRPFAADRPMQFSYGVDGMTDLTGDNHEVIAMGLVRGDVTNVEIITSKGESKNVPVVGHAFAGIFPGYRWMDVSGFTAVLRDSAGHELYRGQIDTDY